MGKMRLTRRELRLADAAADLLWWFESQARDIHGQYEGPRQSMDAMRKRLEPYVRNGYLPPLHERVEPQQEARRDPAP